MTYPTTNPSPTQSISFKTFIQTLLNMYEAWYIPRRDKGVSEIDLEYYAYKAVIEGAQKQIDALQERHIQFLRQLDYKAYLTSIHWSAVRKMMLEHAGHRCQLCNTSDRILHVHHRTYENRGCETIQDLIVLCADCHAKFHDKLAVQA